MKPSNCRTLSMCALICGALSLTVASASPIPLSNNDFSDPANDGSVGGGLLGASGDGPIGTGPWQGNYAGVLGLLAPPVLSIDNGEARISQIGVGVLGIANKGAFYQNTNVAVQPSRHYVLAADMGADSLLTIALLDGGNAGLALSAGSALLGSTSTASNVAITGATLGRSHVAFAYDSSASDSATSKPRCSPIRPALLPSTSSRMSISTTWY